MTLQNKIDSVLEAGIERGAVAGVAAAVTGRDGLLYEGGFGERARGSGVAMTPDTVGMIASMTKAITGAAAMQLARLFGPAAVGFAIELQHHLLPDDDWLVAESAALAGELGLPVVVTNDVHYARPEDRELQDVLTAIRHGRTLDTLGDLRQPDGESYLKSPAELMGLPPGDRSTADLP